MNKKVKTIITDENPLNIKHEYYFNTITVEDLFIIDKTTKIPVKPKDFWYLRWPYSFQHDDFSIHLKVNENIGNVVGIYHDSFNDYAWNKNEGYYMSISGLSELQIRDDTIRFEIVDSKGIILKLKDFGLEMVLILSF